MASESFCIDASTFAVTGSCFNALPIKYLQNNANNNCIIQDQITITAYTVKFSDYLHNQLNEHSWKKNNHNVYSTSVVGVDIVNSSVGGPVIIHSAQH